MTPVCHGCSVAGPRHVMLGVAGSGCGVRLLRRHGGVRALRRLGSCCAFRASLLLVELAGLARLFLLAFGLSEIAFCQESSNAAPAGIDTAGSHCTRNAAIAYANQATQDAGRNENRDDRLVLEWLRPSMSRCAPDRHSLLPSSGESLHLGNSVDIGNPEMEIIRDGQPGDPAPCDGCPHATRCAARELACAAYRLYARGAGAMSWSMAQRVDPTRELYLRLFSASAA